jgi:DNA-binding response OmpR family regulator
VKILLLDSDHTWIKRTKRILQDFGHTVESSGNGVYALLLLQKNHYDVLITGVDLQGLRGDELIKNVKRELPPAILGIGADWECRRLLEAGASMCLEKPFGIHLLIETINNSIIV